MRRALGRVCGAVAAERAGGEARGAVLCGAVFIGTGSR